MKDKIIKHCHFLSEICVYLLFFYIPMCIAGAEIFAYLGIVLWFLKRILGYRTSGPWGFFPKTVLNKPLLVFLLANILATIFSSYFALSFRGLFAKEIKFILIYLIVVEAITNRKRLIRFVMVMLFISFLIGIDTMVQMMFGRDFLRGLQSYQKIQLSASLGSPNDFAGWLIIIVPFLAWIFIEGRWGSFSLKIRKIAFWVGILLFICLMLTYCKGAWQGFFVSCFLSLCYFLRKMNRNKRNAILAIFVILIMSVFLLKDKISTMMHEDITFSRQLNKIENVLTINDSITCRQQLWGEAVNIIEDFPLLGTGLNTYTSVVKNYKNFDGGAMYAHNSFLQMAAETGLIGLLAFFWVLFEFFRAGWRHLRKYQNSLILGLMTGILAFLIQSFVDTNLYALQLLDAFWFMLGLGVTIMKIEEGEFLKNCEKG